MGNNVLVVAFDGLDSELIEEFGLEKVKQSEFGNIDNDTGISSRKTGELFASFITGKTHEQHGIEGIELENTRFHKLEGKFGDIFPLNKFQGLRTAIYESINRLDYESRRPHREDIPVNTLFEEIPDSEDLFVPSYSKNWTFVIGTMTSPMNYGASRDEVMDYHDREYEWRKQKLFEALDQPYNTGFNFLMCHFHRPDLAQHMFAYDGVIEEEKLKQIYYETDELAKEIIEQAEDSYDYIIFMSDHGLPTEKGHNENAFYSCNRELFGEETPHITDFHDKILELTQSETASNHIRQKPQTSSE